MPSVAILYMACPPKNSLDPPMAVTVNGLFKLLTLHGVKNDYTMVCSQVYLYTYYLNIHMLKQISFLLLYHYQAW